MGLRLESALVLAAGFGTRMRHLTAERPKPLVEVAGLTLLDRVLDRIVEAGLSHAVVNVHYKADLIIEALDTRAHPRISVSDERDALLDTGGGVTRALPQLGSLPFLIHNSDSIWLEGATAAIPALARMWESERMDCLMLLADPRTSIGFDGTGDFMMAPDGRLMRRPENTDAALVFAGVSIAHPRLFDSAPPGAYSLNVLWDRAIARGRLFGMRLNGQWMHVGSPEAVKQAEAALASQQSR